MKKGVYENFYKNFEVDEIIDKKSINSFLLNYYENLSDASLGWRIYELKSNGFMIAEEKGTYLVLDKDKYIKFKVEFDEALLNHIKDYNKEMVKVKRMFPDEKNLNICIWNTRILNSFTTHQTFKNYNIIEIDNDRIENLFYNLRGFNNNVFMMKDIKNKEYLLADNSNVIDKLPLRSPLEKKRSYKEYFVSFPKIEKILVDIFVYNKTILPYDNEEIENIYRNVFKKHIVKRNTLLNYARIRGTKIRELVVNMLLRIGE
ncbi:DUF6577 family protein [Mycoplasmatota bacterium WC30]